MDEKYLKAIAQSLKGIHQELKKMNEPKPTVDKKKYEEKVMQPKNFI